MIIDQKKVESLLGSERLAKLLALAEKYQKVRLREVIIIHFGNPDWFVFNTIDFVQYVRWDSSIDNFIYEGKPQPEPVCSRRKDRSVRKENR